MLEAKRSKKVAEKKPRPNPYVFRRNEVTNIWIPIFLKPKVEAMVEKAKLERMIQLSKEIDE